MLHDLFSDLRFRLRALFRHIRVERELDYELTFHLEMEVEKHIRLGLSQVSGTPRRTLGVRRVGAVQVEMVRDERGNSHHRGTYD